MNENHHTTDGNTDRWPRQMPFRVPQDFFHTHRIRIMQEIRQLRPGTTPVELFSELERLSPLLAKTKLQGVTGRWDDRTPANDALHGSDNLQETGSETPVIMMKKTVTRKKTWWMAAAVTTGLIVLLGFLMNQQNITEQYAQTEEEKNLQAPDSIGFSDEEIASFLNESEHSAASFSAPKTNEIYSEINVNGTEMLIEPVLFDQQMESIPVTDLEAYIEDLAPSTE